MLSTTIIANEEDNMYKHSFKPDGPWQGEFDHPQQALDAGRAMYGNVTRVYVGKMELAYWSDMFIGVTALLAYMREDAEVMGDTFVEPFDELPTVAKQHLDTFIRDAIGEWEDSMPDELKFTGEIVKQSKGYVQSAMVRQADFT